MNPEMEEKISDYLDDSLSAEEMAELADWIKADPANARQFARASMLHDRLQSEMKLAAETKLKIIPFPTQWVALAAAAAVMLLVGIQFWPSDDTDSFVTIARVDDAALKVGERRGEGTIQLDSGMVRLLFDSGVEVTLQGPAEFELVEPDLMILSSGLLTANVPPGAEGFRVDTPTAQVTDLGTAFGIHLDEDGASHVSFFDGEVEVEEPRTGVTTMLTEGEEVVVTTDHKVESVSLDVTPYEKLWPVSTGIESSTGSFELAPPWPRRMPLLTSDDHVFVAPDGYRVALDRQLQVNISEPGEVALPGDFSPTAIPANKPLRSYILHYRPETESPRRFPIRLEGTITFDQPIVGLIVANEEFAAAAGRFTKRKAGEKHPRRQLELSGDSKGDRIELSDDMKTLRVDLAGSRKAFDVIRVVVDAAAPGES
ncbi:MAG: FecR domain-containing protein [Verrucomicrobiota bacterium]